MAYREPDTNKIIDCLVNFYYYDKEKLSDIEVLKMFNDINIFYKMIFIEFETKPSDLYIYVNLYLCKSYLTFDQFMLLLGIAKDYIEVLVCIAF